ncbi:MAG TPA: SufD family Fe-S cluster assembly protein, partial [Bacteroidales bacterium]|nr:SufD family Fe-S cluster assembly protein [Bacteroidales bacterium]
MKHKLAQTMDITQNTVPLKELLLNLHHDNLQNIEGMASRKINNLRQKALRDFEQSGFPTTKLENWRFTDISRILSLNFEFDFRNNSRPFDLKEIFTCEVYDLDTYSLTLLNGWFVYKHTPLYKFDNGVIIGSLAKAMEEFPEIVEKYLGSAATTQNASLTALNTAFMQDGLFVYVPEGIALEKPIQLVNIVNSQVPVLLQPRSLVIAEAGSELTLVHCDHALSHTPVLTNNVLEVFVHADAQVDHYKVQNKGKSSALFTSTYFQMHKGSKVSSCIMTLNGGFTRNSVEINLLDPDCQATLRGLYLADRTQFVDNQVLINHSAPNCFSNQLFKGILDDQASAV